MSETLEWRDVDEKAGMIALRRAQSKNGRARTLPLEGEIGELIKRQTRGVSETDRAHNPVSASSTLAPATLIPFVFSHDGKPIGDFRIAWDAARTAVRNLIRAGVPQQVAKKMSGHETDSTFNRYNIVSEEDMRLASKRMQEYVAEQRQDKKVVKLGTK